MRSVLLLLLFLFALNIAKAQESTWPLDSPDTSWLVLVQQGLRNPALSGAVRMDYFSSSRELDDRIGFLGGTAQLKMKPYFSKTVDGKLEVRVTNPGLNNGGRDETTLLEGYITLHFARLDVRAGKQIVAWGRADGINPTDNLTPHDFDVLLPFEEDQRFGLTALKLDFIISPSYSLRAFTTPFFRLAKFPDIFGPAVEKLPEEKLANSTAAIKLDKTGGTLDWSLSYFHGYSLLPSVSLPDSDPGSAALELNYDKINVIGGDVARNVGRFGVRGELAYFFTSNTTGDDPIIKKPFFFYVIGSDRTFFENLNINLQLVGRWVNHYTNPQSIANPVARELGIQNAITAGQQDRTSYGLSTRVSKKWFNDTFEAEVLVFANFTRPNNYIRPLISYTFSDQVKGTVGAELYTGAEETYFGRVKANEGAFAELRFSF